MAKPRVIIADEDENYIIPLQFKFVTDFFNKIDLEIITDRAYFDEFFSKPQNAEILIVSDNLYDSSLQRHNIQNIFVMMEIPDDGGTGELNINRIYKYTSVKEIFNEIVGKSSEALDVDGAEKKETQLVLVTSAAGGVGKTTVGMGVAACLAKNYKKVLYLNASRLQNFQFLLDNSEPIISQEVYSKLYNPTERVYQDIKHVIMKELFSYLPAFKAGIMSMGIDYSIYEKIAVSAKASKEYDYIVIDAESTFDMYKTNLIDVSDNVIIVTDQSLNSVYATNSLISNISVTDTDKYIFACNKFDKDKYNALILPEVDVKFTINEYVKYDDNIVGKKAKEFSDNQGIQRLAFLIV